MLQEAQNAVAARALFWLFPELPLYRILPEPYRTMCFQWHAEGWLPWNFHYIVDFLFV
jgi:hypothetical protein